MWHAQQDSKKLSSNVNLDSGYDSGFLSSSLVDDEMKTRSEVITDSGLDLVDNLSRIEIDSEPKQQHAMDISQLITEQTNITPNQYIDKNVINLKEYILKDEDGDTLLHNAIIYSYHTLMLRLVLNAPDPTVLSCINKDGHTPLHLAVLAKQSGIVRLLVLSGAHLTARSNDGNTPLHLACQLGSFECAKALLDPISLVEHAYHIQVSRRITPIPQDLEIKNYTGQACLHIAIHNGSVAIIRHLLCMGADLEAREGLSGKTALMIAIMDRKQEVIDFLLNECRPNFETRNYAGLTAYQVALSVGNYELADRLHAMGAIAEPLPEVEYSSSDEDMDDEDDDHPILNNSLESN